MKISIIMSVPLGMYWDRKIELDLKGLFFLYPCITRVLGIDAYILLFSSDGQKMSKRKKNYPDPMHIVNSYGADALRWDFFGGCSVGCVGSLLIPRSCWGGGGGG